MERISEVKERLEDKIRKGRGEDLVGDARRMLGVSK